MQMIQEHSSSEGILDAIMAIARKQAGVMNHLRSALERGNESEALQVARELVGIVPRSIEVGQ